MLLFQGYVSSFAHNGSKFQNLREKSFVGVFFVVVVVEVDPSSVSLSSEEAFEKNEKINRHSIQQAAKLERRKDILQ